MDEADVTRLILIPAGLTEWEKEQRVAGNTDVPVSPDEYGQIVRWAQQLREVGVNILFSGIGGPAEETASKIAGILRIRHRTEKELGEVNLGLWQGMFLSDIRQRQPKVFKQWQEQPEYVTPPEGERLGAAQDRIEHCVGLIVKKHPDLKIGVVLGPLGLALARICREEKRINDIWDLMKEPLTWHEYMITNTVESK
jgi:broad specificity phosphatase PhoE